MDFDTIADLMKLNLKERYLQIRLIFVFQYPNQTRGCMYERNRYLVDIETITALESNTRDYRL